MIVSTKIHEIQKFLNSTELAEKTVGFVPTMGALHTGHISLIKCSQSENDITVVSIFVNPTQFNNKKDLKKYPRDIRSDLNKLKQTDTYIVFTPDADEMYPKGEELITYDLQGLDKVMEGKYREGHFNGVVQIVSKLFQIVKPDKAYFGKKDFQQVSIIKFMNKQYLSDLKIEIVDCDIIREPDGLAMSSRNILLSQEQRSASPIIYKTLQKYLKDYNSYSVDDIKLKIISDINSNKNLEVEYIEIVDNNSLQTVKKIVPGHTTACIAVFAGNIRLIDNFSI